MRAGRGAGGEGRCARPPFALERLEQLAHDHLVYRHPKPQSDGRTELRLTPLELIEPLAALVPTSCRRRVRKRNASFGFASRDPAQFQEKLRGSCKSRDRAPAAEVSLRL